MNGFEKKDVERKKVMNNKEIAYRIYNLNIGDYLILEGGEVSDTVVTRVPGGWIWGEVFVPFNNEFYDFAHSPTKKKIELMCGYCKNTETYDKKESYQKEPYFCIGCGCKI